MCDYCSIMWHRSKLIRDAAGFLACPDDQKGRDIVTLNKLNAQSAMQRRPVYRHDGGGTDPTQDDGE